MLRRPPISTLFPLHDALPISFRPDVPQRQRPGRRPRGPRPRLGQLLDGDRKSTRLNSSHRCISYAVFCLKKKNKKTNKQPDRPQQTTISCKEKNECDKRDEWV